MRLPKFIGKRGRVLYSEELGHTIRELPPIGAMPTDAVWLSIPEHDLRELVKKYIGQMETEESEEWCKCLWRYHPDDQEIEKGHCRHCELPRKHDIHEGKDTVYGGAHAYGGKRKQRVDDHPECPVHTREGLVMYFFEWMFTDAART